MMKYAIVMAFFEFSIIMWFQEDLLRIFTKQEVTLSSAHSFIFMLGYVGLMDFIQAAYLGSIKALGL